MGELREFSPPEAHGQRMVFAGRGMKGWKYFCPECGTERTLKASDEEIGRGHGTTVQTLAQALLTRFLAAVCALCKPPRPWTAIATLMVQQRAVPRPKDFPDFVETLRRQARNPRNRLPRSVEKDIRREARLWTQPI